MTIDEAIAYARKTIENFEKHIEQYRKIGIMDKNVYEFIECKKEQEQLAEWLEELKEYKELEEQGLLLKLPYNMQTGVVYYIDEKDHDIYELRADKIEISKAMITNKFTYTIDWYEFYLEDFGKIVFTTKKEAEQALEKMKAR